MLSELPTSPWVRRALLAALLLAIVLLTYSVLQPFVVPLIWGVILTYISWPLNQRLLTLWQGRFNLSALATTIVVTLVLVVPLVWLFLVLRVEAVHGYERVQSFLASKPTLPPTLTDVPWLGPWLQEELQNLSADPAALNRELRALSEQSPIEVTRVIGSVGRNATKLFFAMLSMFFLLRDGPRVFGEVRAVLESVLGPRVRDYLDAVGATTKAVVYALILGAIAQGLVAGLGYWIFGVNAPALLGAVTALIALIPFGAPVVWGSMSIWLLITGNIWSGIGLMLWGILLVSWIDNIIRPLVISNATRMPFLLVVFGVLGGVLAFGLVGLFIGPVLLAVSLALWREWLEHQQQPNDSTGDSP
jgi:predicted PurR-regulated permease PerM